MLVSLVGVNALVTHLGYFVWVSWMSRNELLKALEAVVNGRLV